MDHIVEPISKNIPDGILPKELAIKIDTTGRDPHCQLWVGIYKAGPLKPADLFNSLGIEEALRLAGQIGIDDQEHVMLTGLGLQQQDILLFSKGSIESGLGPVAVEDMAARIEALKIKNVGFYISPGLFGAERALELTENMVHFLCEKQTFDSIYLFKGEYDYNRLLNLSLRLKAGLDSRHLMLSLYH